jgi:hypothetical protein
MASYTIIRSPVNPLLYRLSLVPLEVVFDFVSSAGESRIWKSWSGSWVSSLMARILRKAAKEGLTEDIRKSMENLDGGILQHSSPPT